ncbi:MAG: efflux RND transporter periplasmic adaptor subunit [Burkholderiales bacterium]|jgi:membrane fusion protein (multidrug efflux system)|nr:efflux RND transporter periplasmic adaptor subunit [Burkholderiales bacterium]
MQTNRPTRALAVPAALSLVLVLAACGKQAAVPTPPPVPEVGVITVEPKSTPLSIELVGDIRAFREVELRPRVTGVVERQMFRPGQMVREGDPLFLIDTRTLDSAVADAQARLLEAEAQLQRAQQDVERYKPLLVDDAIPRQTYDQAVAAQKQAQSLVESRREGVTRARIDRGFAEVRAPVTGQIGIQQVEIGGLATSGQTVLAVVSTLDPVLAYFSVSENEYLDYMRRIEVSRAAGRIAARAPIELLLADGSQYKHPGRFDLADRAINPQTGTLTLRAVFPNPEQLLRPGMTGRVRIVYDVADAAIVIPMKAVTELLGRQFVSVVGADGKVEQRAVTARERIGDEWLIQEGLKPGDTVVVEGVQKARPGATVRPVPVGSPAAPAAPVGAAKK